MRHDALRALVEDAPRELSNIVVGTATIEAIVHALALYERNEPIIFIHPRWVEQERAERLAHLPKIENAAAVFFTSGTTGRPKAVLHTQRSIEASCRAVLKRIDAGACDRWLCALPIAHVAGFAVVMRAWLSKATIIAGTEKDLPRATIASLVPTMLHRLLDAGFSKDDAPELHTILLGGASASSALIARAKARGLNVVTTYGLTETFGGIAIDGVPLDGVELRISKTQTIEVRGPMLTPGYADSCPLDQGAFFDTGDIGELDRDGTLSVLSRRTELIITGGENVYPAEVEAAIELHPEIERACVFGAPDEVWGEVVCAVIVPRHTAPVDRVALEAHLSAMLAPFKRPRRIMIARELPETPQGKLDRAKVRQAYASVLEVDTNPRSLDTAFG